MGPNGRFLVSIYFKLIGYGEGITKIGATKFNFIHHVGF